MIQNPELDEESSPEWEEIKNYVGGANRQSKHPLQMEQERIQRRKPQHMDEGGVAGADFVPNPQDLPGYDGPLPTKTPPMAPTAPIAPPAVTSPPPTAPAQPAPIGAPADAAYEGQATKAMGGVTPEMIQALAQKFARPTAGQSVGMGVAGIGDAIASIGGRDPGHMKQAEENFQKNREMQMKVPEAMAAMGKEKYGLTKELGNDDPKSMRSYVQQQANKPLLKDAGFSDAEIKMIPASAIEGLRTGALKADEIRSTYLLQKAIHADTAAYQQGMLKNTETGLKQAGEHQKAEEANAVSGKKLEAAKALSSRGILDKAYGLIPWTASHDARKVLEDQLNQPGKGGNGHGVPDLGDTFNNEKVIGVKKIR